MPKLGIVVFGCLTIDKYRQQIEDILYAWGNEAIQSDCLLRFYTGDIPEDISEEIKALSVDVKQGDGYQSAQFKQWKGLEDIINTQCDFYYVCGSDTYLNVKNTLKALEAFDKNSRLYLGDSQGCETIFGEKYPYFSGGAGFFLTYSALNDLVSEIPDFISWWMDVSSSGPPNIYTACDLQLGILCKKLNITTKYIKSMYGVASYKDVNKETLISCHPMSHEDMRNVPTSPF